MLGLVVVEFAAVDLLMVMFLAFQWLCCVCSQTRLGPGPRQQGRQVQGEGYLPPLERSGVGTEGAAEGRAAQAQRGRLGTLLVARQGRSPSGGLVTLLCAERRKIFCQRCAWEGGA